MSRQQLTNMYQNAFIKMDQMTKKMNQQRSSYSKAASAWLKF